MLGLGLGLGKKSYQLAAIGGLQPFTIAKFVALGASITNSSFEPQVTRDLCHAIALEIYGKTVTVVERATAGKDTSEQLTDISGILSEFSGQSHVVFANHIGGNDIVYGTPFSSLSQPTRDQLNSDYNAVWTAVEAAGHRYFPFGLTFRNSGGGLLDNDPAVKSNELGGSYSYNREWIKDIVQTRAPHLIQNDELGLTQYEYTRSCHDIFLDTDNIHPTEIGEIMDAVNMFLGVMEASEGRLPSAAQAVNFNNSYQSPATSIDIVVATHTAAASITPTNANINWVSAPYGTTNDMSLYSDTIHNSDGSAATGVSILVAGANKSYPLSAGSQESGDTSATLNNSELRNSYISRSGTAASIAVMISGLEPNRTYEASLCFLRNTDYLAAANTDSESAPTSDEIATFSTRADPHGRIFIRVKENNASDQVGLSGFRVRSI